MAIDRPERETQDLIVSHFRNELTSQKHGNAIDIADQGNLSKIKHVKSGLMREVLPEKARLI